MLNLIAKPPPYVHHVLRLNHGPRPAIFVDASRGEESVIVSYCESGANYIPCRVEIYREADIVLPSGKRIHVNKVTVYLKK